MDGNIRKIVLFKRLIIAMLLIAIIISLVYLQVLVTTPNELLLINGEDYLWQLKSPFSIGIQPEKQADIMLNGSLLESRGVKLNPMSALKLRSNNINTVKLQLTLFGILPVKTMLVETVPRKKVIPCGNTIGVKIYTEGVLVVGTSQIEGADNKLYQPFKEAGVKAGDYILEINDKKVADVENVSNIIQASGGQPILLKISRNNVLIYTRAKPVKSLQDDKFKMGLWLRESTAGIGTMTFFDPDTNVFAALGHGITDIDTGTIISISKGEVLNSNIVSVKKGMKGLPGELRGIFMNNTSKAGNILDNNEFGIFGTLNLDNRQVIPQNKPLPIALRSEVKEGPAQIISCISGNKTDVYNIVIQKVYRQSINSSKSMVIKITDERLLNYTGGIVQGMSGSPIIQNGKLVGAVTHVLVNDPTRGYGIFVEWMMKKAMTIPNREEKAKIGA